MQTERRWRVRSAAIGLVVLGLVGMSALVLLSPLSPSTRAHFAQGAMVGGGVLAAACGALRAWWASGRRRRAWLLLSAGLPAAALGNLLSLLVGTDRFLLVGLADAGLLVAMTMGVVGLLTFPSAPHQPLPITRTILDGIVAGGATLFAVSTVAFAGDRTLADLSQAPPLTLLLPVLDSLLATVAVLLIVRSSHRDRWRLSLLTVGFVLIACSDIALVVGLKEGTGYEFGSISDLGWISGYLVLALGALLPERLFPAAEERAGTSDPVPGTVLVFVAFLIAGALGVVQGGPGGMTPVSRAVWLITLGAVSTRQVLQLVENERLRRALTDRVTQRTTELRQANQQTGLMVDSVDDGIYVVDQRGLVTFANPAAERLLGHAPGGLVGEDAHARFHAGRPDGVPFPAEGCYIAEAIHRGEVTTAEEDRYVRRDGRLIPVEVTASPLRDENRVHGAVVVFRDMTERQQVDQMKSQFVSVVSHELRTPLTSIRGVLGLLSGGALGPLDPRAVRMVGVALASSERLTRLINDILDLERLTSGELPMVVGRHEVRPLVLDAVEQATTLADQAGVELVGEVDAGEILGDADRITQALLNLISNALKFAPAGTTVTVRAVQDCAFVRFDVTDHGRGIPPHMLQAVFARFQQVDSSDAREKGGTGLGLAISRSLVEGMGGRMWVVSEPEVETTFSFTIPCTEPLPAPADAETPGPDAEPAAPAGRTSD